MLATHRLAVPCAPVPLGSLHRASRGAPKHARDRRRATLTFVAAGKGGGSQGNGSGRQASEPSGWTSFWGIPSLLPGVGRGDRMDDPQRRDPDQPRAASPFSENGSGRITPRSSDAMGRGSGSLGWSSMEQELPRGDRSLPRQTQPPPQHNGNGESRPRGETGEGIGAGEAQWGMNGERVTENLLLLEVVEDLRFLALAALAKKTDANYNIIKKHQYTGFVRLKYKIERAIWSDVSGQYTLLLITVLLLALSGGAVYSQVTGEDLPEALWRAQLFVLDSGSVSEEQTQPARLVGLVLTVVGLLLVSVLVGIVSQTIEQQVANVTSQITQVLETDHIVVLNWNSSAPRLIRELSLGNRDVEGFTRNNTIAVLAEAPQRMMANAVREVSRRADVLCIEGSPQMVKGLEQISATRARAVIILADDDKSFATQQEDCDANAITTMLAITTAAAKLGTSLPPVVMEVHSADTVGLVRRTFGDVVYPILIGSYAAKMTVQTLLMPGVSQVYKNLLSFDGSEFYFLLVPPSLVGMKYGRLVQLARPGTIPVGLQRPAGLEMLPAEDTELTAEDQIVLLQASRRQGGLDVRDGARLGMSGPASLQSSFSEELPSWELDGSGSGSQDPIKLASNQRMMDALFNTLDGDYMRGGDTSSKNREPLPADYASMLQGAVLICGWRPGIAMVLRTLDRVMSFGSEVHVLADVPLRDRDSLLQADGLDLDYIRNIKLKHFHGRPGLAQDLAQLPITPGGYTAAVLLANWTTRSGNLALGAADAVRMKAALLLRDFLWQRARDGYRMENTYFVTEVSGAGTDVSLPFSEFVEVGALDVMAISQVVFQPYLHNLQMQLLNTGEGVHITLEPVTFCARLNVVLSFREMSNRVSAFSKGNSLLIGYKRDMDVMLNPEATRRRRWDERYELVLLNRRDSKARRAARGNRREQRANNMMRRGLQFQKALGSSDDALPDLSAELLTRGEGQVAERAPKPAERLRSR
eukprot:jgi/Tetstr1/439816/TSEL_028227.t2